MIGRISVGRRNDLACFRGAGRCFGEISWWATFGVTRRWFTAPVFKLDTPRKVRQSFALFTPGARRYAYILASETRETISGQQVLEKSLCCLHLDLITAVGGRFTVFARA
jgi:hypothetical protein